MFSEIMQRIIFVSLQSSTDLAKVMAFNALIKSCRNELAQELDKWNAIRLTRDDNDGDR